MFMVVALVTVFRTKRRSVRRRKSIKDQNNGEKPNLNLFKYVYTCTLLKNMYNLLFITSIYTYSKIAMVAEDGCTPTIKITRMYICMHHILTCTMYIRCDIVSVTPIVVFLYMHVV